MTRTETMTDKSARQVQKRASLDEKTVQKVAEKGVQVPERTSKKTESRTPPVHTHIKWDQKLWAQAQAVVRPGERLVPISETEARTEYI